VLPSFQPFLELLYDGVLFVRYNVMNLIMRHRINLFDGVLVLCVRVLYRTTDLGTPSGSYSRSWLKRAFPRFEPRTESFNNFFFLALRRRLW
jgi:hypothetical protein